MLKKFDHQTIEKKWQEEWVTNKVYQTTESNKPKAYVLDMFPYPSGEGLHVGHPKGYIATDIYSRFKRMTGHEVLHPMGWDAFGLPAENFAIKHKVHPRVAVEKNVARFKEQLGKIGFDYDWGREINTTDPEFYKWTQWIFIQLFKKGLAYESHEPINWCPGCQTGLANEDIEPDGTCERCDTLVEKKPMRQWVLKIRDYADRMLEDLDTLSWPEHIKEAQRNWIGRSEGAEISFELLFTHTPEANANRGPNGEKAAIPVFTTRPDTLFGATFMVLAPDHPWVTLAIDDNHDVLENKSEVSAYVKVAAQKSEIERTDATKEKTGVELKGVKAINPANGEQIPMFVADYVLAEYGTGAIMAVPGHDDRDYEFAKKFSLPIKQVISEFTLGIGEHAPRSEEGIVTFRAATCIIKHWSQDKYYVVEFSDTHRGLVGGSVEKDEHIRDTAMREATEESGYTDVEYVQELREYHIGRGFKARKQREEICHDSAHIIQLKSDNRVEIIDKETTKGGWRTKEEILNDDGFSSHHKRYFEMYLNGALHTGSGTLVNSGEFDGMNSEEAKKAITEKVGGKMISTYKIKDWVFSRQRYWGEPIPIVHCAKCGPVAVPEEQLPLVLPEVEHYEPAGDGQSPLATITDWVNTTCPECSGAAKRETNTMPQWAGSSWYYLRFMDPHNSEALVSKENEKYWAPVDVYVGGDHAVRHLIYARFWHKFLYDIGVVSTIEPFQRLEFLGFILAEDGRKMSKRWGNVINPDDVVEKVGADTLRVYEMFMGPFENTIAWSTDGLVGARRFLERVNGLSEHITETENDDATRILHKTIKKVSEDIEAFKFNTAVSSMMIYLNEAEKHGISKSSYEAFLRLLAPFAPHLTEDLWQQHGTGGSVHLADFPTYDEELAKDDLVTIGVQINGKVRGEITLSPTANESEAMAMVKADEAFMSKITGEVQKVIYVPGRILNLIIKS